jgi:Na+/melibiose symporter-like transporter
LSGDGSKRVQGPESTNQAAEPAPDGLLQQRPFRMLCYTKFFSRMSQNAVNFALVLLIVDETGQALMSSLLVLALVVPSTIAGLAAGVAADAWPKRLLVFLGNLLRASILVFFAWGSQDTAALFLVAALLATIAPFPNSADGAIQPLIVERPALARSNAITQAVGSAAQLLGLGVLAPVILRVLDTNDGLFYVAAALYIAAAVSALLIGRVRGAREEEVGGEIGAPWYASGWRAIRADPVVLHAAIELTLISATLIVLGGLIPTYIEDTLGLPVDVGAVVLVPGALGVVFGLRVAGFLAHRVPHGLLSTTGFATFVVLLALMAFVNPLAEFLSGYGLFAWLDDVSIGNFDGGGVLAIILIIPAGFSYAIVQVAAQTVLNDRVPLQLQGRVNATQAAMAGVVSCIPVVVAGALADLVGVNAVMATVAFAAGGAAVLNLRSRGDAREPRPATAG